MLNDGQSSEKKGEWTHDFSGQFSTTKLAFISNKVYESLIYLLNPLFPKVPLVCNGD